MAYSPNVDHAEKVQRCLRAGVFDHDKIAKLVGITTKQLVEHYPVELELSNEQELMEVADVAYDMAVSGKFPHMTQWYLRVKGGHHWKEDTVATGTNESPITVVLKGVQAQSIDDIQGATETE